MASAPPAPRALVVDDDPVTRLLVQRALEALGCSPVLQAHDGLAAQALLREPPAIDLVLTDILMPGMDGLDLLRWGREHAPDTAWIILSGLDTFDSAVEAIRLGAFDFLAKPPRVAELDVAVRNALERRTLLLDRERLHAELRSRNEELLEKVGELEAKSRLLQRDLERAEVIQRALLPSHPPPIDRYCVHALYRPGHHVGGDLYDVARIDDRHLALYVADATGHGVTAAMLSVLFKHHLEVRDERSGRPLSPATVLRGVNRALVEAVAAPDLFLTAAYCLLDTREGTITVASAGHPPILHLPAVGAPRSIQRTGPALGINRDAVYEEDRFRLESGDCLFLYTDGLTPSGAALPIDRLPGLLARLAGTETVLAELLQAMNGNGSGAEQDDVTLVMLEVRPGLSAFDNGAASSAREDAPATPAGAGVALFGESEEAIHLVLRGRGTWVQCAAYHEAADAVLDAGKPLVIGLEECEYLDSTFLGTIHELVGRGTVWLEGMTDEVAALFEELGMDRVLERVRPAGAQPQELQPLLASAPDIDAARQRMLSAHEALSALNPRNRATFAEVVRSLRGEPAEERGGDAAQRPVEPPS